MSKVILITHFIFLAPFVLSETFCNAPSVKDGNFNVENINLTFIYNT